MALGSNFGAGIKVWRWDMIVKLDCGAGIRVWRWIKSLALRWKFGAGIELWRWDEGLIS